MVMTGLAGGESGAKGNNMLLRSDGVLLNLGAKCSIPVDAGVFYSENFSLKYCLFEFSVLLRILSNC